MDKEAIPERPYVITDTKNLEGQRVFKVSSKLFKKKDE